MNPLKFLLGATGSADKLLDSGIKAIDKIYETEEEKHDRKQELHNAFIEQLKTEGSSQQASSITRRVLAFMLCGLWVLYGLAAGLFWGLGEEKIAMGYINLLNETWIPVSMSLTFYFGRHFVESKKS